MLWSVWLYLLYLQSGALGFGTFPGEYFNHQTITERALLNVTAQVCRALALAEGKDFTFPAQSFTAKSIANACEAPKSYKVFLANIVFIQNMNAAVDVRRLFDARYHFSDELLREGQSLITDGLSVVKAANKKQNFVAARSILGEILHTLQDFYSHSNWVELGNKFPNVNMIRKNANIGNIADKTTATCRSCNGDDCSNNILEEIIAKNILTSGYFALEDFPATKPTGKCSHGGFFDATSSIEPKGGINKDTVDSSHGYLHMEAADLAIAATSQLLEDIRGASGDREFLQLMGISKGSSKALCFVVDTTGSMGDDIAAVQNVTSTIIDSKVGTEDEPSLYILVPFNDPDFGPLIKTTDAEVFKGYINSLTPSGGGDGPGMSLSGLQLALTGSPPNSEIFLFTDAPAKDKYLKNTVIALIEQSKTVVNFMITNVLGSRRRRQANRSQPQQRNQRMLRSDSQLYRDLAQASGGQVIQVSKNQLLQATSIITESTSSSLVTLLQTSRNLGGPENYTFSVDETLTNLIIYITGDSVDFTLVNPSGELHNSSSTGPSIITAELVGNLQTLRLRTQVGLWEMRIMSTNPYTLKVVGQSPIDFIFSFMMDTSGGVALLDNRPPGNNTILEVTLLEADSTTVTEVSLVESSGSGQIDGFLVGRVQGGGQYLVWFDKIPSVEFVVLVKGQSTNSTTSRASSVAFQRQSTTSLRASTLTVTVSDTGSVLEPGTPLLVPFSVTTTGDGGNFVIKATNDQGFDLTFPTSLTLESGGSANGTASITAPSTSQSGTGVTLTIEAEAPGGADTNYGVLRLTVLPKVTDFSPPVCQLVSLQSNCSGNCNQSMWELSVEVSDGENGTGIDRISLREGDGMLNSNMTTANGSVTLVSYNASCCSPNVQIVVVDRVGNVDVCSYSVTPTISPTDSPTVSPTVSPTTVSPTTVSPTVGSTVKPSSSTTSSSRAVQPSLLCLSVLILAAYVEL
ncbi:von Willebrand factor A domain-containing protein 7-like [Oryzias melastigma]|uniref:von Willebrand factor A domain-containing protein 7-like n=1 Tax=Oryzias melastigma TaxID=30732 RepID=UPI00168D2C26|nr:von Willebrand factor A domain-containing protein 7-like [Oryzias melastigma]